MDWWMAASFWAPALALLALALFGLWLFWWRFPKRQVDSLNLADPKARADVEDNLRKTITQLLGGAAVLGGFGLAGYQTYWTLQGSHDLLISQQLAKGFELLGDRNPIKRLGGIYALEGVMKTSADYRRPILDALSAFVRESTRTDMGQGPPKTDIQAALTVIGRNYDGRTSDLTSIHVPRADLTDATLRYADLTGAQLTNANLTRADLTNATLLDADLEGAVLPGAHLSGAKLSSAKNIFQAQLDVACGSDAKLPPLPPLPPPPPQKLALTPCSILPFSEWHRPLKDRCRATWNHPP